VHNSKVVDIVLYVLLAIGFFGALKVSYENFTGSPCPHLGVIPICYVVAIAYGLMLVSVIIKHYATMHYSFCIGWGTAFVVALVGSVAEYMAGGGVCPTSGGDIRSAASSASVPLCYASLALLLVILVLFLFGPYKRACNACNLEEMAAKGA